ncbi:MULTISPECIES: hypothetical protein [unclassified Streptomyces]|uniref:hypothetical protein n=1 Tax=unclassified Streptomyces TaxID=2593676 RepID=UPI00211BB88E|nr:MULTISPECIES: hypothetical protein [unclassified Streptomyces]MDN3250117.1 hypothetical protein [Streptomyces sp. ZSW22]MDN3257685.1 hypothetical protein [Streptomyces sp. MA25(2023)]
MKAEDLEPTTVYNYRVTLERVRGKLGNVRLQELTEDHVMAWMRWALQESRVRGGKAGTGLGVTSVDMPGQTERRPEPRCHTRSGDRQRSQRGSHSADGPEGGAEDQGGCPAMELVGGGFLRRRDEG